MGNAPEAIRPFEPLATGTYETTEDMKVGGRITAVVDKKRRTLNIREKSRFGVTVQTRKGVRFVVVNLIKRYKHP